MGRTEVMNDRNQGKIDFGSRKRVFGDTLFILGVVVEEQVANALGTQEKLTTNKMGANTQGKTLDKGRGAGGHGKGKVKVKVKSLFRRGISFRT